MKQFIHWTNRCMVVALLVVSCVFLGGKAYAAEIQMGSGGMLVFEPCELTISVGDTVTFVNNELPPHNVIFADHDELYGDPACWLSCVSRRLARVPAEF